MRFAIVADDLTGAADCAVQFGSRGYRAAVSFDLAPADTAVDALAIDTESRHLGLAEATERAARATRAVADSTLLMKKIDSTLRGQIAAEVGAALQASGRSAAIVAPAFPAYGRTTVGGTVLLDGVPVAETSFADDPHSPVRESSLPAMLGPQATVVPREEISLATLDERLQEGSLLVVDIAAEEDFAKLIAAAPPPARVLWVGSTGLAQALGVANARPDAASPERAPVGRVLVVVGSVNPVAREQLEELLSRPDAALVDNADAPPDARCLVLASDPRVRTQLSPHTGDNCVREDPDPAAIAVELADAAARLVERAGIGGLVLTGGETAIAVVRRLGGSGITLDGEVEPGIPTGSLLGPKPLAVVTKAGGFGGRGALAAAAETLLSGTPAEARA